VQAALLPVADVERALAEVYARPELAVAPESRVMVWLRELWAWLGEWLSRVFGGLGLGGDGISILGTIAVALFVVLAVVLVARLVHTRASWWPQRSLSPMAEAAEPVARSAADWHARARQLAEAGQWREAALALYQALLLGLEARGAVRYDASKTPGDYRRELRGHEALSRLFDTFVRTFEPAAFGSRPADAAVVARLDTLAGEAAAHG
jgi:hypothetical protein